MARAPVRSGKGGVASKGAGTARPPSRPATATPPKIETPKTEPLAPTGPGCPWCGSVLHGAEYHEEYNPPEDYEEIVLPVASQPRRPSLPPPVSAKPTASTPKPAAAKSAAAKPTPAIPAKTPAGKTPAKPPARTTTVAAPVYAWQGKFTRGKDGALKSSPHNVALILAYDKRWQEALAYDEFADCIVVTKKPPWHLHQHLMPPGNKIIIGDWTDEDTLRLLAWIAMEYQLHVTEAVAYAGARLAASRRMVHPVRDWLRTLPPYPTPLVQEAHNAVNEKKGKKKGKKPPPIQPITLIDTWLIRICGCQDTPYIRAVGAKFLIGMVARVMKPGCKLDTVAVFEGAQGILKSSMLRLLCTGSSEASPGDWFLESAIALGDKDSYQQLRRKWLVEWMELSTMKRTDHLHMKAYVSQQQDTYRPSYGRMTVNRPRQCVFAGTTNDEKYHKDDTGGRRWWPIPVTKIDLEILRRERDQMWAEAVARYDAGEKWWLDTPELNEAHAEMIEGRRQADPFEVVLGKWLASLPIERQYHGVTTQEVIAQMQPIDPLTGKPKPVDAIRMGRLEEMRAGDTLRKCGWIHKRRVALPSAPDVRVYRYSKYRRDTVEFMPDGSIVDRATGDVVGRKWMPNSNVRALPVKTSGGDDALEQAAGDDTFKEPAGAKKKPEKKEPAKAAKAKGKTPAGAQTVKGSGKTEGTAGGPSRLVSTSASSTSSSTGLIMKPAVQPQRQAHMDDVLGALGSLGTGEHTAQAIAQVLPEDHVLVSQRSQGARAVETVLTWLRTAGHVTARSVGKLPGYKLYALNGSDGSDGSA
jgi:predicted P-loop ATPase